MRKHLIYLAGPIQGLSYDGATDWRDQAARLLDSDRVETLSPMRGKYHLKGSQSLKADGYSHPMSTNRGIMSRDHFDCCRADVLLVNVLGATKGSLGTAMEVAWAYDRHIPVVLVMERDGLSVTPALEVSRVDKAAGVVTFDTGMSVQPNPHQHAMFLETATYIVSTLEEAVGLIKALLNEPEDVEAQTINKPNPHFSMMPKGPPGLIVKYKGVSPTGADIERALDLAKVSKNVSDKLAKIQRPLTTVQAEAAEILEKIKAAHARISVPRVTVPPVLDLRKVSNNVGDRMAEIQKQQDEAYTAKKTWRPSDDGEPG